MSLFLIWKIHVYSILRIISRTYRVLTVYRRVVLKMDLSFLGLLPRKLTYCLKINGWEMKYPFETVPFLADMLFFFRGDGE